MKTKFALTLLAISGFCYADSFTYDQKSGNTYNTIQAPDGGATVYGNNNDGEIWSGTIDNKGNQHGMDVNGHYWTYDAASGNYINYGTGEICFGKGVNRVCSK